ncbi:MAG: AI-2E family transporter [Gemmatimonadaceae bacterium]
MATTEPSPAPRRPEAPRWRTTDLARGALVALAVWFGLQLLWTVSALVFLVFLATLFGLAVGQGVDRLERLGIRRGVGSALIVFGALGLVGGGLALSAPTLISQGAQLQQEFPAAVVKLRDWVDAKQPGWARGLSGAKANAPVSTPSAPSAAPSTPTAPAAAPAAEQKPSDAIQQKLTELLQGASRYLFAFVTSTVAVAGAVVMLIFLVIYLAAEPEVYHGWLLGLVPAARRRGVREVLAAIAIVLRKWLVTQLIAMLVIGTVTTVVLLLLGVKAAFALGFLAGLFEFIPTVGPILSAVPGILMGFVDSPEKAAVVALAYWGIQFLENNLLIPYLMRGEMDIPPAITLIAQTLMTLVFGFLGLMVAVPLTAAVLVPLRLIAQREDAHEQALTTQALHTPAGSAQPSSSETAS